MNPRKSGLGDGLSLGVAWEAVQSQTREEYEDHALAEDLLEGAQARVPLDCNGKPLTYVAMPQRGRCAFDSAPHFKNEWCFRWYVLRVDEAVFVTPGCAAGECEP